MSTDLPASLREDMTVFDFRQVTSIDKPSGQSRKFSPFDPRSVNAQKAEPDNNPAKRESKNALAESHTPVRILTVW